MNRAGNAFGKVAKTLALSIAILSVIVVAIILVVPMVVDVDRYRPYLESKAEEYVQGDVELGKLSLSLWGKIHVNIAGLKIRDTRQRTEILSVQDAYFHLPFTSILQGSPRITLKMNHPRLKMIRDSEGHLNLVDLIKKQPEEKAAPIQEPTRIPGILARAKLGVEMRNADLSFVDQSTGAQATMKNLNALVKNLSISDPTLVEIWADLDSKVQGGTVQGPIRIDARLEPRVESGKFQQLKAAVQWNLDALKLDLPGKLIKGPDSPAHGKMALTANQKEARIDQFFFQFLNAELTMDGKILQGSGASSPVVDLNFKTNEIPLAPWGQWVPKIKEFQVTGLANATGSVKGPADQLSVHSDIRFRDGSVIPVQGTVLTDLSGEFRVQNWRIFADSVKMNLWNGQITSKGEADLKPAAPTYRFQADLQGLDLQQAAQSSSSVIKNTVTGKASANFSGNGTSFDPDQAKQELDLTGSMKIEDAKFVTIDVAKMISEGVNQAIQKVSARVPSLKGKEIKGIPQGDMQYDQITSSFSISKGVFSAPDFYAKAKKDKGIDVKGSTQIGLKDQSLNAKWQLIDEYNLTRAKDVSIKQAGVEVKGVLTEKGQPLKIPVTVNCTLQQPCYSYTEVPEYLASIALSNVKSGFTEGAAKELTKKLLPKQFQNKFKNVWKGKRTNDSIKSY